MSNPVPLTLSLSLYQCACKPHRNDCCSLCSLSGFGAIWILGLRFFSRWRLSLGFKKILQSWVFSGPGFSLEWIGLFILNGFDLLIFSIVANRVGRQNSLQKESVEKQGDIKHDLRYPPRCIASRCETLRIISCRNSHSASSWKQIPLTTPAASHQHSLDSSLEKELSTDEESCTDAYLRALMSRTKATEWNRRSEQENLSLNLLESLGFSPVTEPGRVSGTQKIGTATQAQNFSMLNKV